MTSEELLRQEWIYIDHNGKVHIKSQSVYRHIKSAKNLVMTDKDNMYMQINGRYRQLSIAEQKAMIKAFMPVEYRNSKHIEAVFYEFHTDYPDVKEEDFNSNEAIINFQNGIYDIYTNELQQHDPKHLTTVQIPCNFVPDLSLDDAPNFKAFTNDLFGSDEKTKNFWLEFIGAVLSNIKGWRFKKMLLMVGEGNTGKTLALKIIMELLGQENCVAIDFKKMTERFGTAPLYGKRLNGVGDLAYVELSEVNTLKELTGGDILSAEFKGKDSFSFQFGGFIWVNCNRLPYFRGDRGQWVYDRFCIINCSNIIPEERRDPQLLEKILAEKEVIVSVAIHALQKTIAEKGFKFSESELMLIARKKYMIENNSLLTFIKECCEFGSEKVTNRSAFNMFYRAWCENNAIRPERDRDIKEQLESTFGIAARKTGGNYVYDFRIKPEVVDELTDDMISREKRANHYRCN